MLSCVLVLLVSVCATEASANPTLDLLVEPACATPERLQALTDEIGTRLPQLTRARGDASVWHLRWMAQDGECALVLSDIETVAVLPLGADATGEAIRDAVVRIAWFVSMEQPREATAEPASPAAASLEAAAEPEPAFDGEPWTLYYEGALLGQSSFGKGNGDYWNLGGRLGVRVGERFGLGLTLHRPFASEARFDAVQTGEEPPPPELAGGERRIDFAGFGGLYAEYTPLVFSNVSIGLFGVLGGGGFGLSVDDGSGGSGRSGDGGGKKDIVGLLYAEAGARVAVKLTDLFALDLNLSYRGFEFLDPVEDVVGDLDGPSLGLGVRILWPGATFRRAK